MLLVAGDVLLNHTALADGFLLGHRIAPFDPPLFWHDHERALALVESHLASGEPPRSAFRHDAELGWGHNPASAPEINWAGARGSLELAREKAPGVRRIAAFGSSFTYGTEVAHTETWSGQLQRLAVEVGIALEVVNMGVEAYGIDQAFLRWRRDGGVLAADEVWLSFAPQATLNNLTLYRPTLAHWASGLAFKPRFVAGADGTLELVPNPAPSLADVARLLHSQQDFVAALEADAWVRRAPAAYAPLGSHWSHHSALARLLLTGYERLERAPAGWLSDETSEAFTVVRGIVRQMAREVESSGARFRLLVLPDRPTLAYRLRDGRRYWDGLADTLRADGVLVTDLSQALAAANALQGDACWAPEGHYSVEGNRVVAEALLALFEKPPAAHPSR